MIATVDDVLRYLGKTSSATPAELDLLNMLTNLGNRKVQKYVGCDVVQQTYTEIVPGQRQEYDTDSDFIGYEKFGNQAIPYFGFDQRQVVALRNTPVRSIQAVYLTYTPGGGTNPPPSALLNPGNYYLDNLESGLSRTGFVVYPYGAWPIVPRSTQIQYTAGFSPAELDVQTGRFPEFKLAVCMTVAKAFRTAQAIHDQQIGFGGIGTITSESMDGVSFSYDSGSAKAQTGQVVVELTPEVQGMLQDWVNYTDQIGFIG